MLNELRLQNFRCFSDHTLPFKTTSIVIGRNNAGKSTVVEALRLISIVVSRHHALVYHSPPSWLDLPKRDFGVAPSLKGMEINFQSMFNQYGEPPSIITGMFENGSNIKIYLGAENKIHAVIKDSSNNVIQTKAAAITLSLPRVEIMPQVGPVAKVEVVLSSDYVKGAVSSYLAPLHFRNQLNVYYELFPIFKEITESTWSGLQVRDLIGQGGHPGAPLSLHVRNEGFVADVSIMGHGLQMWLQTMWFLARSEGANTIILDEPDVYMHPDLQRRLIRFLRRKFRQVIVATHSVEIMAEVEPDEILIIDRKRSKSRFTNSLPAVQKIIDHVGSVHNIHLAKLWHSRKVLFLEGKDIKLLNEFHELIFPDSKESLSAIPNVSIGGWGGWSYAVGPSKMFKKTGGQSITVFCILDSDYHSKEAIKKRMEEARENGIHLHIWKRKEIENYCLVPDAIHRFISVNVKRRIKPPAINVILDKLNELALGMKEEIFDAISQELYVDNKALGTAGANKIAREILSARWKTTDLRLSVVSGKEIISRLSQWSQNQYEVSFSPINIARMMHAEEIPEEVRLLLAEIDCVEEII